MEQKKEWDFPSEEDMANWAKRMERSDNIVFWIVTPLVTAFTALMIYSAVPKIQDYVFLIDRNSDGASEQYVIRDHQLQELDPSTLSNSRIDDPALDEVIRDTFRFDILHSPSWTSQGLSLRPDLAPTEAELMKNLTYCELSDYLAGKCQK